MKSIFMYACYCDINFLCSFTNHWELQELHSNIYVIYHEKRTRNHFSKFKNLIDYLLDFCF